MELYQKMPGFGCLALPQVFRMVSPAVWPHRSAGSALDALVRLSQKVPGVIDSERIMDFLGRGAGKRPTPALGASVSQ
jgi:hypothetical protein